MRRLIGRLVLVLAAALALAAVPAGAAQAYGGGCINWSANGFHVGVCASERDGSAYPDLYLNGQPANGANCTIRSQIIGPGGDPFRTVYYPCTLGHHGPFRYYLSVKGYHYYHLVAITVNGTRMLTGNSPQVWR